MIELEPQDDLLGVLSVRVVMTIVGLTKMAYFALD